MIKFGINSTDLSSAATEIGDALGVAFRLHESAFRGGGYFRAEVAKIVEANIDETLTYYALPAEHWRSLRTNNPLERLIREIRRRTRVVGALPDGKSALMLVAARLRHVAATNWGIKRYLQMNRLAEVRAIA